MKTGPTFSRSIRSGPFRARRKRRTTGSLLQQCCLEALEERCLLSVNVTTFHNDLARDGLNSNEVLLNPGNVNSSSFGKLISYPVSGQIYGQPLYVSNLNIPGLGVHDVVFVVTEHDDVYAFDADSNAGANGGLIWHDSLGSPAATPNNVFANRYGPYHDINPQVGITSTPVIDLATDTIYIDAFTNDNPAAGINSTQYSHHLWALDLATGAQKVTPTLVAAMIPGTSAGSVNGTLTFTASQQLQRSALTLYNGILYVEYTGYADTNPYHGWILGFDPSTLQLVSVFNTTPTLDSDPATEAGEGGIWQAGNGLSSDGSHLYIMTANGDFNSAATSSDWGDSFLQLAPTTTSSTNTNGYGMTVTDFFTPFNEQSLADADADLGSGGALILPDLPGTVPHEMLGAGKQGIVYLVDRDNMGGHTTTVDNVVQTVNLGGAEFGSAAYFNNTVYYHPAGTTLKAYSITAASATSPAMLSTVPIATGGSNYGSAGIYGTATPSVSSNGNTNGIVWEVQFSNTGAAGGHAILHAYDAITLQQLYNSDQNSARDALGTGVKFITPTIADGKVFVGTDGALVIFGLLAPPTQAPSAPTGLNAAANVANQISLTWTDTSSNESGFKIERSTDGVNFTQIALTGVNATSYNDNTVTPGVTYTYRVRATNVIGDSAYTNTASATAIAASVPVDLYHFDEGTGTITVDSAGTNNGTLIGNTLPQWVTGEIGTHALSFSGDGVPRSATSQSAVQTNADLSTVLGSTSTLTAWIKTSQRGTDTNGYDSPAITGVELAGGSNDIRFGYIDSSGHIGISAGNGQFVSTSVVADGNWHNVAFTRNEVTGQVQIYVDGVLQTTGNGDTGVKTSPFRLIGAQTDLSAAGTASGATYFNGILDDVRIYNQILTPNEISSIGQIPATPTGLTPNIINGSIIQLTWNNVSSFAQNIEIDRRVGTAGAYSQLALVSGSTTQYNDINLTAGTQYFYKIRAIDLAGSSAFTAEVSATPPQPTIVGRYTFYNDSVYDGQNGSSNVTDDNAVDPTKQALLPGETATFANYTSYDKGLNGVMIDVANLLNLPTVNDFTFMVGNNSDPSSWQPGPTPTFVNTYPGRGVNSSTRIVIVFDNNAIQNEWLQVFVKNTGNLNLASTDTFYFGNAIGDSGDNPANAYVNATDELAARAHPGTTVGVASDFDYNRDGNVNALDEAIAHDNATNFMNALQLITVPGSFNLLPAGVSSSSTSSQPTLAPPPPTTPTTAPVTDPADPADPIDSTGHHKHKPSTPVPPRTALVRNHMHLLSILAFRYHL